MFKLFWFGIATTILSVACSYNPMNSRDRVVAVLEHRIPDRVPIVLGPTNATGIKMPVYQKLRNCLSLPPLEDPPGFVHYIYQWPELGTAALDEPTYVRLGTDVRSVLDLEPQTILAKNRTREPHCVTLSFTRQNSYLYSSVY